MAERIVKSGSTQPENTQCCCDCGCGNKTRNGAAMCNICASEICKAFELESE